jgi:hypothetical protein
MASEHLSWLQLKCACPHFVVRGRPLSTYAEEGKGSIKSVCMRMGEVNTNGRTHGGGGGSCSLHLE